MPLYTYQCLDCAGVDHRLAGLDDHTALCTKCRGLMLRRDEDVFKPYFDEEGSKFEPQSASGGLNY
ncbi:MAG: hypothetical protein ACOZF2_13520 [Thermodesulfobacteriota bacterium]